jgi:hypothetical protein
MKHATFSLLAALLVLLAFPGGCGKKEEQPTRFNDTLDGTPAVVPSAVGPLDTGVLKDPAGYQPAQYESLGGGPAVAAGEGVPAAGPEAEAIQAVVNDLITGVVEFDIDMMLEAFVPEQVAALRNDACMSAFYETRDTFEQYQAVLRDKAADPQLEERIEFFESLPSLAEPLRNTISVTVLDEGSAVALLDLGKYELPDDFEIPESIKTEFTAGLGAAQMMAQMGGPGAPGALGGGQQQEPNAAAPLPGMPPGGLTVDSLLEMIRGVQIPIPLRKVEDRWRVDLQFAVQPEHAELATEGLLWAKGLYADITDQLDQLDGLDLQTYRAIETQAMTASMGTLMQFAARIQAMAASAAEGQPGAAETTGGARQPPEPNAPPQEPNAP